MDQLIKLTIKGFKGIKEAELRLPRVSILIGRNNSGKTTVLEALYLLSNPCTKTPYVTNQRVLNVLEVLNHLHSGPEVTDYSFLMYGYSAKEAEIYCFINQNEYGLKLYDVGEGIVFYKPLEEGEACYVCGAEHVSGKIHEMFIPTSWKRPPEVKVWTRGGISFLEALYVHPNLVKYAWSYFRLVWPKVSNITPKVVRHLRGLITEEIYNITLEPFSGGKLTLYAMLREGVRIRLSDMGDGVQLLTTLFMLYEHVKPKVLLIDDVESHLNPRALRALASWLFGVVRRDQVFLVASTHSLEAAKLLTSVLDELGARTVLLDLKDGVLNYRLLTVDELEELEASGIDVRLAEAVLL